MSQRGWQSDTISSPGETGLWTSDDYRVHREVLHELFSLSQISTASTHEISRALLPMVQAEAVKKFSLFDMGVDINEVAVMAIERSESGQWSPGPTTKDGAVRLPSRPEFDVLWREGDTIVDLEKADQPKGLLRVAHLWVTSGSPPSLIIPDSSGAPRRLHARVVAKYRWYELDAYFLLILRAPAETEFPDSRPRDLSALFESVEQAFAGVQPWLLAPNDVPVGQAESVPRSLRGDAGRSTANEPLQPLVDLLDNLRRWNALGDVAIRRWSLYLHGSHILSNAHFPSDVVFNTALPWIPRLLAEARSPGGAVSSPTPPEEYMTYCLLFPARYLGPQGVGTGPIDGERAQVMAAADAGEWLTKTFSSWWRGDTLDNPNGLSLFVSRDPSPGEPPFRTPWGNCLRTTWVGLAMQNVLTPWKTNPALSPALEPAPQEIDAFDRSTFRGPTWIFPVRRHEGQRLGFGLCALMFDDNAQVGANARAVLGDDFSLKQATEHYLANRHATAIYPLSLALSLAALFVAEEYLILNERDDAAATLDRLENALFPGVAAVEGIGRLHHRQVVVDAFLRVIRWSDALVSKIHRVPVFRDFLTDQQHSYIKHHFEAHMGAVYDAIDHRTISADDRFPRAADRAGITTYIGSADAVARNLRRALATRQLILLRNTGQEVALLSEGSRGEFQPESFTARGVVNQIELLHGHRALVDEPSAGSRSDEMVVDLDLLESRYWRIVHLHTHFVHWSPVRPLFDRLIPGLLGAVVETLLLNGLKHARTYDDRREPRPLDDVRVDVSLHQRQDEGDLESSLIVWDNRPDGISDPALARIIERGLTESDTLDPLNAALFPRVRHRGEQRGKGMRPLLHLLAAQHDLESRLGSGHVGLYLVPVASLQDPSRLPNTPVGRHLCAVALDWLSCRRPPKETHPRAGAFVFFQARPGPTPSSAALHWGSSLSAWVLDSRPPHESRPLYRLLDNEWEQRPAYHKLQLPAPEYLPDIVLVHVAYDADYSEQTLRRFIASLLEQHSKSKRDFPALVCVVSASPPTAAAAAAISSRQTGHHIVWSCDHNELRLLMGGVQEPQVARAVLAQRVMDRAGAGEAAEAGKAVADVASRLFGCMVLRDKVFELPARQRLDVGQLPEWIHRKREALRGESPPPVAARVRAGLARAAEILPLEPLTRIELLILSEILSDQIEPQQRSRLEERLYKQPDFGDRWARVMIAIGAMVHAP